MQIGIIGLNYKSSDLALREIVAKEIVQIFSRDQTEMLGGKCVVLSTCNRSEIYFSSPDLAATHSEILALLRDNIPCSFQHHLYSYFGDDCFRHLAKVTSGLDSALLGECEIQRQVKMAYEQGALSQELPSALHFLFQKCLKIGKWLRSHCLFPKGGWSLEKTVVYLSDLMCKDLSDLSLFFLGNSEINRKMLPAFKTKKVRQMTLCTRSLSGASEFGGGGSVAVVDWQKIESWQDHDIVICGTSHASRVIFADQLKSGFKCKVLFDLSVPRVVDPELARHPELLLMNIEEICLFAQKKRQNSEQLLKEADKMVQDSVARQLTSFHNKNKKREFAVL